MSIRQACIKIIKDSPVPGISDQVDDLIRFMNNVCPSYRIRYDHKNVKLAEHGSVKAGANAWQTAVRP